MLKVPNSPDPVESHAGGAVLWPAEACLRRSKKVLEEIERLRSEAAG